MDNPDVKKSMQECYDKYKAHVEKVLKNNDTRWSDPASATEYVIRRSEGKVSFKEIEHQLLNEDPYVEGLRSNEQYLFEMGFTQDGAKQIEYVIDMKDMPEAPPAGIPDDLYYTKKELLFELAKDVIDVGAYFVPPTKVAAFAGKFISKAPIGAKAVNFVAKNYKRANGVLRTCKTRLIKTIPTIGKTAPIVGTIVVRNQKVVGKVINKVPYKSFLIGKASGYGAKKAVKEVYSAGCKFAGKKASKKVAKFSGKIAGKVANKGASCGYKFLKDRITKTPFMDKVANNMNSIGGCGSYDSKATRFSVPMGTKLVSAFF